MQCDAVQDPIIYLEYSSDKKNTSTISPEVVLRLELLRTTGLVPV